jgi:hypothetical protein
MVVALTALVVASSGTAIAASLVNGDKLIKKHSLSGNRLKNHTLTGTQVNLSKLGTVPTAANVTGVMHFIKTIAPAGTTPGTAARVTLGTSGPLTVSGFCYLNAGKTDAATYLSSTVPGHWNTFDVPPTGSNQPLVANTPVDVSQQDAIATPGAADYRNPFDGTFSAITATLGNYITGLVSDGANLTSANDCTFAGFTSAS